MCLFKKKKWYLGIFGSCASYKKKKLVFIIQSHQMQTLFFLFYFIFTKVILFVKLPKSVFHLF